MGGSFTFRKQINRRYPDLEIQHFHHAGNSSGVVDGAAALLLTSKDYADKHGLKPRARVVAYANIGDDPTLMLNAPVPAAKKVLEKAGLTKETEEHTSELQSLMRISYAVFCLKKK